MCKFLNSYASFMLICSSLSNFFFTDLLFFVFFSYTRVLRDGFASLVFISYFFLFGCVRTLIRLHHLNFLFSFRYFFIYKDTYIIAKTHIFYLIEVDKYHKVKVED